MDDFPSLSQSTSSTWEADAGIETDMMMGGTIRSRRMYSNTVFSGKIIVMCFDDTERTTLQTFYDDNRDLEFTFYYDADIAGVSYTCRFQNDITWDWKASGLVEAECEMIGTKN